METLKRAISLGVPQGSQLKPNLFPVRIHELHEMTLSASMYHYFLAVDDISY